MSETLDLEISRFVNAPRKKVWQAWTDPEILKLWWCPKPWVTEVRAFDLRPGGAFHTYMTGPLPDGTTGESDNPGVFLEIIPERKIVSTSMLVEGWRPAAPWMPMTAIIAMDDEGDGTRYVARCLHLNAEGAKQHEEMGFYDGWGTCITQLEEVARGL
ncbi:MAG: SRPBCC family protein [Hyphomonadaceae bacterium]|nr:SRPBCC family protein [Hyphomonadaceae bacterium]